MDNQNNSTTTTFLPPPIDGEASAPLAQPDDDFVVPLSVAGTPNTPADDGGTGSTVSPVSPVHLNRQQHGAMMMDDDQAANTAADSGATDDSSVLLPPPDDTENEEKPNKDNADDEDNGGDNNDEAADDDDQVPVLAMSGILPATATGGGQISDSKKNAGGPNDSAGGGAGTGNGENKSKEKSRYTTGSGTGAGTDAEDSGTNNPQTALGCGTTFEYVVLVTACSFLLVAVTGTTVYWTMAYRGGYDPNWFPWPPQTPLQMLTIGVFTYKHPQNITDGGSDISTTISTTTVEQQQSSLLNISSSNVSIEDQRFNLHPTLMTIGFVTLTGFSILVYRMAAGCSTSCRGSYVKLTHGLLHMGTIPCVLFGGVAAMEYHRLKGLPHMYSLHSWMGLLTLMLFAIQLILGLFTFVVLLCCRGATAVCRLRCFTPIHATLGLCTFTLAIATCLTGLQQRADFSIFSNNNGGGEQTLSELIKQKLHLNKEPVVVNVLAVLLVSVLVIVSYTVRRESLKRRPNNKPSYTATVSPLRVKSSSSSTGKFGTGKQSSQPPV
ncbi:uncharacterized protein LOC100161496 isoform X2 [Acyrthosiphon pisum]|uniref:Cytochrome b561 domain-containing protein n=1 Tax=Acyrthosiphon pisum TaxID=7029 RepID=A0A8R1W628_ACYPI|nr:uncharacterized protein LOC100161496 isoform X2 [Acyrthosiphon pisum]|eukprot:XP_001949276.1 PREDICTED: uncharacterized protein LOC100161496 isoform X2 [Acyrthosiphon pisum]